jgi:nucleoside-diphosphate-sugar epimerase
MSTILVTGAAGFIAHRVCQELLAEGHTVVGVDNMNDGYDARLKKWHLTQINPYKKFTFHHLDVSHARALDELGTKKTKFDAVINLAARAGVRSSTVTPKDYFNDNVTGTLNLLEFCREQKIPKFVLASSSSVYGVNPSLPTVETADTDHPMQPYAASKKAAEVLCHSYHFLHSIDVTVFRYFIVYGPGNRPDQSMFRFTQWISEGKPLQLYGDGEQKRGFTFVDDIARGTILGLKPLGYEIINLGGHELIVLRDMISRLEKVIGKKAIIEKKPAFKADMLANWANVDKAEELLGWKPQVSFDEGIQQEVDWYQRERKWTSLVSTE